MTARLKSELWVQALLRRCSVEGKFGAVLHKGNPDAGVVMVVVNHLDGGFSLLVPPPGPAYNENGDRRFEKRNAEVQSWEQIQPIIERTRKSDNDVWVVEVEDRGGFAGIAIEGI